MKEMGKAIELASICGLGRSVPVPLMTAAAFFQEDINKHLPGDGARFHPKATVERVCR
jgi:hypothetical protein